MNEACLVPACRGESPDEILKRAFFPAAGPKRDLSICMREYIYDTSGREGSRKPADAKSETITLCGPPAAGRMQGEAAEKKRASREDPKKYQARLFSLTVRIGDHLILRYDPSESGQGLAQSEDDAKSGVFFSYHMQTNAPARFFRNLLNIARKDDRAKRKMLTLAAYFVGMVSEQTAGDECGIRLDRADRGEPGAEDRKLAWDKRDKVSILDAVRGLKAWMWENCWGGLGPDPDIAFCGGQYQEITPIDPMKTLMSSVGTRQGYKFLSTLQDHGWRIVLNSSERSVKEHFTEATWDGIREDILQDSRRIPLFQHYLKIPKKAGGTAENKRWDGDAQELGILKLSTEISLRYADGILEHKVDTAPMIRSTDQWLDRIFEQYFRKRDTGLTRYDFIRFLGEKAAEARDKPHTFVIRGDTSDPAEKAISEETGRRDNLLSVLLRREGEFFKFSHKPLRVVIDGFASAEHMDGDPAEKIADRLMSYAGDNDDPDRNSPDHTKYNFGNLVIYGCAVLHRLSDRTRADVVRVLIDRAEDFRGRRRLQQEKAICLLSYLLCEKPDIPGALREQVFISTYGNALYHLQETEWQYLSRQTPYYQSYVRELWKKCCVRSEGYAEEEPRFMFLRRMEKRRTNRQGRPACGEGEDFLDWCCEMRHHVWFDGDIGRYRLAEVLDALREARDAMKAMPAEHDAYPAEPYTDGGLYTVYGTQMLLVSLSSLTVRVAQKEEVPEKSARLNKILNAFREQLADDAGLCRDLLEAAVLADCQMRLADRYYNIPVGTRTAEEKRRMYLLCGPFRFICAYYPYLDRHGVCVSLPESVKAQYTRWYREEYGRYRMLLARLLSYAGIGDDVLAEGLRQAFEDDSPLAYDNLPEDGEIGLIWEIADRIEKIRRQPDNGQR